MNLGLVARFLGLIILSFSGTMLIPFGVGLCMGGEESAVALKSFPVAILTGAAAGAILLFVGRGSPRDFYRKEGLLVVSLAWFAAGGIGAIPFVWSEEIPRMVDALLDAAAGRLPGSGPLYLLD